MTEGESAQGRTWRRVGCVACAVIVVLVGCGLLGTLGVALWQARGERREVKAIPVALPDPGAGPGQLTLVATMAELVVVPAPPGSPLRLEAELDPRRHALSRLSEVRPDGTWTEHVAIAPVGSRVLGLLRVKAGAEPPRLRVAVPRGQPLRIVGWIEGGLAALELGGLELVSVDLQADGAAIQLSFAEPLPAPMERLRVAGTLGSVEVTGVGHASPRTVLVDQRLGHLDLDLRGAWQRDADVRVSVDLAGGSAWLPDDVAVERVAPGTLGSPGAAAPLEPGAPPRLRLELRERRGRLVIVQP